MKRTRRLYLVAALAVIAVLAACTLNPQPLPPVDPDNQATPGGGFGAGSDSGTRQDDESPTDAAAGARDSGAPPKESDAGDAGGDAGDAGDAGGDAGDAGDATTD